MSIRYFQTISDELAALIDDRRGPLTLQEFTTLALAAACEALPLAKRIAVLEQQVAALQPQPPTTFTATITADEMLRF